MLRQLLPVVAVIILCWHPRPAAGDDYTHALDAWSRVLQEFVDNKGRIDFQGLTANREDLDHFVNFIAKHSPASSPAMFPGRPEKLAYYINSYNALAMHSVIEKGIPADLDGFFKRLRFFKLHKITVGNEKTSLYDYENKVILPMAEERVHFALNCMVRGCPRLPVEPFRAATLEKQLQAAATEFFSTDRHIIVDHDRRTVWLSWILEFYMEDFIDSGRPSDLIPYVNRYREPPVPHEYRVRFMEYDWTINRRPDNSGHAE